MIRLYLSKKKKNRLIRLVKFSLARLSTFLLDLLFTFLFVTQFPHIIGQFVNENIDKINAIETIIAQILIIIINYILSKIYIFRK
ncbi:GtrA family protein [Streptococcus pneumoniae]|nr:GtrA family protein [Streptococcus pneumoniae]VNK18606.1 GtrA family protein [Streptococcus pneumoniae]